MAGFFFTVSASLLACSVVDCTNAVSAPPFFFSRSVVFQLNLHNNLVTLTFFVVSFCRYIKVVCCVLYYTNCMVVLSNMIFLLYLTTCVNCLFVRVGRPCFLLCCCDFSFEWIYDVTVLHIRYIPQVRQLRLSYLVDTSCQFLC